MTKKSRTDTKGSYSRVSGPTKVILSTATKEELPGWLNMDVGDDQFSSSIKSIVTEIETVLGVYESAVKVFDNEPRPANILSAVVPVRQKVEELFFLLIGCNDIVREQLKEYGFNTHNDIETIIRLQNAAVRVEKKNKGKQSRHAVPRYALEMVIVELHNIFNKYYQSTGGEYEPGTVQGSVNCLTEKEYSLKEFVQHCLNDGDIQFPNNLKSYLDKEFSKVQFCAL